MIYDGPHALLRAAEHEGWIKVIYNGNEVPIIDVFDPNNFEIFLLDVAGKTDSEEEKVFCLSNLQSFKNEQEQRLSDENIEDFREELTICQTADEAIEMICNNF